MFICFSHLVGTFEETYEANRAQLSSNVPSSSNSSFDAIFEENNCDITRQSHLVPPKLDNSAYRQYALSLLSRIASLTGVKLDEVLTTCLLPPNENFKVADSSRTDALTKWGSIIFTNLLRTDANRFTEGVQIWSVVDPTALANLNALATC